MTDEPKAPEREPTEEERVAEELLRIQDDPRLSTRELAQKMAKLGYPSRAGAAGHENLVNHQDGIRRLV